MGNVPRRLRYKKNGEEQQEQKTAWQSPQQKESGKFLPENYKKFIQEHATSAGMKELHRFHKEHNRAPQGKELEQMAQSIYSQWKAKEAKNERYHHHEKGMEKKHEEKSSETLAEKRKSRREGMVEKRKQRTGSREKHGHGKQKKGKEDDFKEPIGAEEGEEDFEEPGEIENSGKEKEEDLSGLLGEDVEDVESLEDEEDGKDAELEFFEEEKPLGKKKKPGQK